MTDNDEVRAIDLAKEAVTQFVEEINPGTVLTTAVLVYETSMVDEDGDITYQVRYSSLTDSSMSSVAGTLVMGQDAFMRSCEDESD